MLKLFKLLKPNTLLIILCIILVSVASIAALLLPDRMSVIIGEGITSEYQYEFTQDDEPIYINLGGTKVQLPKFVYEDAGQLVLAQGSNGDYNAILVMEDSLNYKPERDKEGELIYLTIPTEDEIVRIPMPMFLRTVDGTLEGENQQGSVMLDSSGSPRIEREQVSHMDVIIDNGLLMLGFTLVSSVASIIVSYLSATIGMRFGRDVRSKLFRKTINFSQEEVDQFGTASLITRATNDVTQIQTLTIMMHRMMFMIPVMFIGGLVMSFRKDPDMSLILLVTAPIILIVAIAVATRIVPLFKKMQKRLDSLTMVSRENVTGVRVIRAFGQEEREKRRFEYSNHQVTNVAIKAGRIMAILFPVMQFIMSMTAIGVVLLAIGIINNGLSSGVINFVALGNMMAVIQYMMIIMMSIIMFSIIFIMIPRASVSASRINEVLATVNKIDEPIQPVEGKERLGTLEFKDVSFAFPNASKNVLTDISFELNRGETSAIIGSTGSGKSTLINLIPRLYDVTNGSIMLDGVDIRDYTQKDLRSRIGFVSQKAILFEGTIRDNICYGNPNATQEEIQKAAKIAQAKEFIDQLSDGYDHWVEQGGANLSGGQKQRLAIARAVCRKPSLYIFDDSFSALDFKTEKMLRKELTNITKSSTVMIVAQRIGTIMNADRIIVMQEGRVVGIGKHRDLLKNCSVYKETAISQMSKDELMRDGIIDVDGGGYETE